MYNKVKKIFSLFMCFVLISLFASCKKPISQEIKYNNFFVDNEKYKLEQMVIISRHNIRSPLSTNGSVLSEVTNNEWFNWSSNASELSLRGGDLETKMGQYFRKYLVNQGLMEENWIPNDKQVRIYANSMQRTIATAKYFSSGMFPIANIDIEYHEKLGVMDPVFFPKLTYISDKYIEAIEKQKNEYIDIDDLQDNFVLLEKVLDYSKSKYAKKLPKLNTKDTKYILKLNEEPNIAGSLKIANTASDALKLQYFEEKDEKKAAFGHIISMEDWCRIGEISDVYSKMLFGLPLIATNVAHPLLNEIKNELQNDERIFTFLCGHDSNIESVLSALDVRDYDLPGVLEKKTPIGGKIVLEKWKDINDNTEYISLSLVYQSLEQLRKSPLLDLANPPIKVQLEFDGLEQNKDGLYNINDVFERFNTSIDAFDELKKLY